MAASVTQIDADVYDCGARLDERSPHEPRPPERRDQDVRGRGDLPEVLRPRVADRDRRMAMQQQHRDGLPTMSLRPMIDCVFARHVDAAAPQELDDPRRRARNQVGSVLHEPPDVQRRHAVHIFRGSIASNTLLHRRRSQCESGSGDCTRIPSTAGSAFNAWTSLKNLVERRRGRQMRERRGDPLLPC